MKQFKAMLSILVILLVLCSFPSMVSAKSTRDKIKDTIEAVSEVLKRDAERFGNDVVSLQNHLDNYQWKGLIQREAASGVATLTDMRLNHRPRVVVVKPEQVIDADVVCSIDPDKATSFEIYRIVIGYKGLGPKTTICNCFGVSPAKKLESFKLKAPKEPGFYEIRFRSTNKILESSAMSEWIDERGEEPDATTTIGIVWVKV